MIRYWYNTGLEFALTKDFLSMTIRRIPVPEALVSTLFYQMSLSLHYCHSVEQRGYAVIHLRHPPREQ